MRSRQVHLVKRPEGPPALEDFEVVETDLTGPAQGEVLVKNLYMSVDPAMRPRMARGYELGKPLVGGALGRVLESRHGDFKEGQIVLNRMGFREYFVSDGRGMRKLEPDPALSLTAYMSVLGNPGLTAYGGLMEVAKLQRGEKLFVSTAAGAVGQVAVQIGKLLDCYVVGSTGSEEKARWLRDELKLDAVINYKDGPINKALRAAAPDGLDVYFDNVGGDHLDAALNVLNHGGRVAVCGMISGYNEAGSRTVVRNLSNIIYGGITIRGFAGPEYMHLQGEFAKKMAGWLKEGRIKYRETILDGIDAAPEAMVGLMHGRNTGKMLVAL
ncbi:MAG: NADP-dependent oxidoreductase [Myxococcales bacterium]|nr:NADP-dependent oxidoreductase [Myxococcales bacterium]MDD9969124.1 NADP-dependent oxidoreductase [Myxococcales bacterium]